MYVLRAKDDENCMSKWSKDQHLRKIDNIKMLEEKKLEVVKRVEDKIEKGLDGVREGDLKRVEERVERVEKRVQGMDDKVKAILGKLERLVEKKGSK